MTKPALTVEAVQHGAADFADLEKAFGEPLLYGVTDGKAVGTYLEQKFRRYLAERYAFAKRATQRKGSISRRWMSIRRRRAFDSQRIR